MKMNERLKDKAAIITGAASGIGKATAIVNISSVAGIRSGAGGNAYSASKAALINFTQTASLNLPGMKV